MFISTAMTNLDEVRDLVNCVKKYIPNKFVLMQCTGNYPSTNSDSNLKVMLTYKKLFNCHYGYSDHTLDYINPIAATSLGASVYEKHFTLDKKMYVFNSKNGSILYSKKLPFIGSAPPTTYIYNNKQYIIIHATGGSTLKKGYPDLVEFGNALVAFKLKD